MNKFIKMLLFGFAFIAVLGYGQMCQALSPDSVTAETKLRIDVKVEGIEGWKTFFDGGDAGTTGQSKRMEAIKMKMYDGTKIEYCVLLAGAKAWSEWKSNGEVADNGGGKTAIVGISIRVRDGDVPVEYRAHVADVGWMDFVKTGEPAGDGVHRIEAVTVRFPKLENVERTNTVEALFEK